MLALDLATVEPSLAGPKRPQDRVALSKAGGVVPASVAFADQAEEKKRRRIGQRATCITEAW